MMSKKEKLEISLVIPAYNEVEHIEAVIYKSDQILKNLEVGFEIIIVDDGSVDGTGLEALKYIQKNEHLKVISYSKNNGKGYALKKGFFSAIGDSVIFMDSDLEIDPTLIKTYVSALQNCDIVIGSKRHPASHVEAPRLRRFLSWWFNFLVRSLTGIKLQDTQSGLKAVKRERVEKVFSVLSIQRYAFDVELLAVATLYGLSIVELPVNIKQSRPVFKLEEIFRMFSDLIEITYKLRVKKIYTNSTENS